MTLSLDQLSDAELNERFAVEVAGWKPGIIEIAVCRELGKTPRPDGYRFCTDANAVLPWLEKHNWVARSFDGDKTFVDVDCEYKPSCGAGPTFARAAVIALLRAKRTT